MSETSTKGQRHLTYGIVLIWGMFFGMFLPWWALPVVIVLVAGRAFDDIWLEGEADQ